MKRIGIAASKISEGNILLYNIFVLVLSTLFSLLVFFLSGFSIFLAIYLIHALLTGFTTFDFYSNWGDILKSCMIALAVMMGLFNICAISVNLKFKL
jgi:hypothetical protein